MTRRKPQERKEKSRVLPPAYETQSGQ